MIISPAIKRFFVHVSALLTKTSINVSLLCRTNESFKTASASLVSIAQTAISMAEEKVQLEEILQPLQLLKVKVKDVATDADWETVDIRGTLASLEKMSVSAVCANTYEPELQQIQSQIKEARAELLQFAQQVRKEAFQDCPRAVDQVSKDSLSPDCFSRTPDRLKTEFAILLETCLVDVAEQQTLRTFASKFSFFLQLFDSLRQSLQDEANMKQAYETLAALRALNSSGESALTDAHPWFGSAAFMAVAHYTKLVDNEILEAASNFIAAQWAASKVCPSFFEDSTETIPEVVSQVRAIKTIMQTQVPSKTSGIEQQPSEDNSDFQQWMKAMLAVMQFDSLVSTMSSDFNDVVEAYKVISDGFIHAVGTRTREYVTYDKMLETHLSELDLYNTATAAWNFEEPTVQSQLADEKALSHLTTLLQTDIDQIRKCVMNLENLYAADVAYPKSIKDVVLKLQAQDATLKAPLWYSENMVSNSPLKYAPCVNYHFLSCVFLPTARLKLLEVCRAIM